MKRKLLNEKGAMDRIIVSLFLIIVGVSALVGLSDWLNNQRDNVKNTASNTIENTTKDAMGESK